MLSAFEWPSFFPLYVSTYLLSDYPLWHLQDIICYVNSISKFPAVVWPSKIASKNPFPHLFLGALYHLKGFDSNTHIKPELQGQKKPKFNFYILLLICFQFFTIDHKCCLNTSIYARSLHRSRKLIEDYETVPIFSLLERHISVTSEMYCSIIWSPNPANTLKKVS